MMQDPDESANYLQQAMVKPSLLLNGDTPRLIDKRQVAPVLWDAVRFAVNQRGEMGQFILTASTKPLRSETMHSGTGRIARLKMRTMSLFSQMNQQDKFHWKNSSIKKRQRVQLSSL